MNPKGKPHKQRPRLCHVVGYPVTRSADGKFYMPAFSARLVNSPGDCFSEVTLVAPSYPSDKNDQRANFDSCPSGVHVQPLPMPRNRLWRWCRQFPILWRAVAGADVVCLNIPEEASCLAALACRIRKKVCMVQVLGDWPEAVRKDGEPSLMRAVKAGIVGRMAKFTVRSAQLVLTQGENLFQKCSAWCPESVKGSVVHSTVQDDFFSMSERQGFHAPARVLSVCGLVPLKGLDYLLQALRILLSSGPDVEWWCVGAGPARAGLQQLAYTLGVCAQVHFLGHVPFGPELLNLYKECDIFVLPSLTEGLPNALLEAMANSMPVVATEVGGMPGLLRHAIDGYVVPPRDAPALAKAIATLIAAPEAALQMGLRGRERAEGFHSRLIREKNRLLIESLFQETQEPRAAEAAARRY